MSDSKPFDRYGNYYDLLNLNKNYEAEAKCIDKLIKEYCSDTKTILEFGSGTGKHATILAKNYGYYIDGIEKSSEMIKRASKAKNFNLSCGDIRNIKILKKFDAVLSLFHVLSYQTENSSIIEVFSNAFEHLRPSGIFICDFWYTPAVLKIEPEKRTKIVETDTIKLTRTATPSSFSLTNTIEVNYEINVESKIESFSDRFEETHKLRHFSLPELDFVANYVGFQRIGAQELLTGCDPSASTWAVCAAYKKVS